MKKILFMLLLTAVSSSSVAFGADLTEDPVFKAKCVMCHGPNAEGREKMKTPAMKEKAGKPESELTQAIENGNDKQTPKMPAFKEKLTPEQIKTLVAEIKALK
jgi:mono/diheme cytochrome c family protein